MAYLFINKVIAVLMVIMLNTGETKFLSVQLPGATLADCNASRASTELQKHWPAGVVKFGWSCVEIDVLPASKA